MPAKPTDAYTANGFFFEIPGLVSPQFHTLEGISKTSGEVFIVDGATGIKHKFSDQLKDYGDISLTRTKDGSVDDKTMLALEKRCLDKGFRFDGNLVKLHNGVEVFRIVFFGLRIKKVGHPTLKTDGGDRYDIKYDISVTEWDEIL